MNVGSLFSGIGGFDLGLERAGMRVEWQVENNEFSREVLKKHWPKTPCHYDITTIDWRDIPRVDLICGGFPCQPFSVAGKQRGQADDRYLWPEVVRCLDALRPTWFLGENVPGLISLALDQVCTDLESLGYTVWPVCVPACAVDAPHIRQRVWILAHRECSERGTINSACNDHRTDGDAQREEGADRLRGGREDVADAESEQGTSKNKRREQGNTSDKKPRQSRGSGGGALRRRDWIPEPAVGRVAHGVPSRVDRLRGLGNAVVPQIVEAFGRMIVEVNQ